MKLNKKVEIGINAVNALKSKLGPTKTADLASEIGTTVNFLEQIMRNLKTASIVSVRRGPGGGYYIGTVNSVITAYDIANAVGRKLNSEELGDTPTSKLRKSIVDAFLNTTI